MFDGIVSLSDEESKHKIASSCLRKKTAMVSGFALFDRNVVGCDGIGAFEDRPVIWRTIRRLHRRSTRIVVKHEATTTEQEHQDHCY